MSQDTTPDTIPLTLHWQSTQPPTRFTDVLSGVALTACIYAAMLLAVFALTLLIVTPVVLLRGEDWAAIAGGWLDARLWWMGLGIVVAMALVPTLFLFLFRDVEAFGFDPNTQQLTTVERRAWFQAVRRQHAFDSIRSITPILSYSGGSLHVTLRKANDKLRQLSLGKELSSAQLQAQADWLRAHFGDLVQPLREDTGD